jgi:hypothetical protein
MWAIRGFWWGKADGKRPLGRPQFRWEDDIKMDVSGIWMGAGAGLISLRIGTGGGHW